MGLIYRNGKYYGGNNQEEVHEVDLLPLQGVPENLYICNSKLYCWSDTHWKCLTPDLKEVYSVTSLPDEGEEEVLYIWNNGIYNWDNSGWTELTKQLKEVYKVTSLPASGQRGALYVVNEDGKDNLYYCAGGTYILLNASAEVIGEKNSIIIGTGEGVDSSKIKATINSVYDTVVNDNEIKCEIESYSATNGSPNNVTYEYTDCEPIVDENDNIIGISLQQGNPSIKIAVDKIALDFDVHYKITLKDNEDNIVNVQNFIEETETYRPDGYNYDCLKRFYNFSFENLKFVNSIYNEKDSGLEFQNGKSKISLSNADTQVYLGGNAIVGIDGNTRFTMHDNAKLDLTGGTHRQNAGPEIYMHGNANVTIDDGWYYIGTENKPYFIVTTNTEYYDEPQTNYSYNSNLANSIVYYYYDGKSWNSNYYNSSYDGSCNQYKSSVSSCLLKLDDIKGYFSEDKTLETFVEKTTSVYDETERTYKTKYYYEVTRTFSAKYSNTIYPSLRRMALGGTGNPQSGQNIAGQNRKPSFTMMNSPSIYIDGFPDVVIEDSPKVKFVQDGEYFFGGDVNFMIRGDRTGTFYDFHGRAWQSPQWGRDSSAANQVHIMGTNLIKITGSEIANEIQIEGCQIQIGTNPKYIEKSKIMPPSIKIAESVDIQMGNAELSSYATGYERKYADPSYTTSVFKFNDRARFMMDGFSDLRFSNAATIRMFERSLIDTKDRSSIEMMGSSRIALSDTRGMGAYGSAAIIGNPNQIIFGNLGFSNDCSEDQIESADNSTGEAIAKRLNSWDDVDSSVAIYKEEVSYWDKTSTTEYDINRMAQLFNQYISDVNDEYIYYNSIKETTVTYITDEEHSAFMEWAVNQYGTGNYNYNRCYYIFNKYYFVKPEKRQGYFDLTGDTTVQMDYALSTYDSRYKKIIENGETFEDYFDIIWVKYDYYYNSYGYYYSGNVYYYNASAPSAIFKYIQKDYYNAYRVVLGNHPEYLSCISYVEKDNLIYPYQIIDYDKYNELKNNFSKYNSDKLFINSYDSDGNVLSRKLQSNTKKYSMKYCWEKITLYRGNIFCVQGDSRIIIGSSSSGWMNYDETWQNSNGRLFINIAPNQASDNMKILMSDSIFIQATGQSHMEMHNNSTFIMRGEMSSINGVKNKPWSDGIYDGWQRPVLNRENSPCAGIYDSSTILIRGVWNTEETFTTTNVFRFNYENTTVPTTPEEFDADMMAAYKAALKEQGYYYVSGGTVTSTIISGQFKIVVTNAKLTDKPPTWVEHPTKQEDSPLIEIIENSEIHLGEHFSITGNDDALIISNGTNTRTFKLDGSDSTNTIIKNLTEIPSTIGINNHEEIRINDTATSSLFIVPNVSADDFYGMIVVKVSGLSTAADLIDTSAPNIKVINGDLDISSFTVAHINLYYDGFNTCVVVSGYN